MWHWAQVLGSRAMRTELVCRVWQAVQVADGAVGIRPADAVALFAAAGHRRSALQLYERMWRPARAPGWYVSEKFTCSGVRPFSP